MTQNMPLVDIAEEMEPILALRKRTLRYMKNLTPESQRWFAESLLVHLDAVSAEARETSDGKG